MGNVLVAANRDDCGSAADGNGYTAKVMDLTYTEKHKRDAIKGDVAEFGTMLLTIISRFGISMQEIPYYRILKYIWTRYLFFISVTQSYKVIFAI